MTSARPKPPPSDSDTGGSNSRSAQQEAVVLSATRRHVLVSTNRSSVLAGTVASRGVVLVPGDKVRVSLEDKETFVTELLPRTNELARSYRGETKSLAANLDHLYVVTATPPLLNTLSIDRMAVVAASQGLKWSLIFNKIDLGVESCHEVIRYYESLGIRVFQTAAKFGKGLDGFVSELNQPALENIALCGISGVGKSTILNRLVPQADRTTAEVSERTGQGKQTTSQPSGFLYPRPDTPGLLVIDLPGVQQFGVGHLKRDDVILAFPEFRTTEGRCEFSDCAHLAERSCAVRDAVQAGKIAKFRYESYEYMLTEIEDAKPY